MLDDDTRKLLHEVGDAAGAIGDDAPVERFYHEHEIGTLFDRCRGMFGALVLLVDHGFVQEAAVFCRPMFVDSLALAEIAEADEQRRVSLIAGRQLDAIADIDGIFRELQARGDEVAKNLDHMAERRRKVEQYAYRRDASTRHWNPEDQVKALAEKHARGDEYASYRMTSHFVHGSAAITEHRSSVDEEDVARNGAPHLDVEIWERPTAHFGAYSLALASRAVCSIFGYEEPQDLGNLLARIEASQNDSDEPPALATDDVE
jgi:hypothetical protein